MVGFPFRRSLIAFEESLEGRSIGGEAVVDQATESVEALLSIPEVCQARGMDKSWVYRRLKDGDIPSIKLGRATKIRQADLEKCLETQRYIPPSKTSRHHADTYTLRGDLFVEKGKKLGRAKAGAYAWLGKGRVGISGASHSGSETHPPSTTSTGRGHEQPTISNGILISPSCLTPHSRSAKSLSLSFVWCYFARTPPRVIPRT
jgi:excisionase family DNA binding protein